MSQPEGLAIYRQASRIAGYVASLGNLFQRHHCAKTMSFPPWCTRKIDAFRQDQSLSNSLGN
jgi:hypothetical protein